VNKTILNRLAALEARHLEEPDADRSLEQVMKQLDLIAERLHASPDWKEPTPEQRAQSLRDLDAAVGRYGRH
jgi:hypothetical protein